MGKISYSDHVKKSDISVIIAEIIFQSLKKTHKLLPLSKVVNTSSGGTPSRTNHNYYGGDIPWLKSGEMNDSLITQAEEFITEEGLNNSSAKIFPKGTLLVAMYGATAGKTGILDIDASTNQAVCAVTAKNKSTDRDFLFWFFRANRFYFIDISRGGAQPNISQSVIGNTDFPIVEYKLQKNIALFLSNLEQTKESDYSLIPPDLCKPVKLAFDYLSCLQKLECENRNQEKYVSQLKQAILQEAIAGQLTAEWRTQNPRQKGNPDTDATALLAKIKAEKQQLIADGKLKKEKPLAEIAIDEIPFSIPDSWVWTRTEDICFAIVDCPHSTPKYQEDGKNCIDTTCFDEEGIIKKARKVDEFTFIERNQRLEPLQGDIVYSREGIIGQAVILPESPRFCLGQRVMLFRPWKCIQSNMFRLIIVSPFFRQQMVEKHKGMGAKHVNMKDLRSGLIPLPPLAEQKAIVEKVDKLMNIIDQLEQQIKHRKQLSEDLMQTVLREAFE